MRKFPNQLSFFETDVRRVRHEITSTCTQNDSIIGRATVIQKCPRGMHDYTEKKKKKKKIRWHELSACYPSSRVSVVCESC